MVDSESSRISVVITTHNRKELLTRAVRSVLNQSYGIFEIIIVDDCSDDGTQKLYTQREKEGITYIRLTEKSGANVARNLGIKLSRGSYIAFLDDDDFWKPNKLETQISLMNTLDASFSFTGLHTVTPQEKTVKKRFHAPQYPNDIYKSLMIDNFIGTTSSIVVKKSLLLEFCIRFDERLGSMQDYDFYLQCFLHTKKIASVEECLTYYHKGPSFKGGNLSRGYNTFIEARDLIIDKHQNSEHINLLKKSFLTIFIKKCIKYPPFFVGFVKSLFK